MLSDSQITGILSLLNEAGREILDIYRSNDFRIKIKEDNSPVTMADLASDTIIKKGLSQITPGISILSEESKVIPFETRSTWDPLWILDPLDGTREFIAQNDQFCISLALLSGRKPVAAFIQSPVTGDAWYAIRSAGAFLFRNGKTIRLPLHKNTGPLVINISNSHYIQKEAEWIETVKMRTEISVSSFGSALKFCRIAEGTTDLYPKFGPIHEWDVAGGHLLMEEAGGGIIETNSGLPPVYNKADFHQPPFIAFSHRITDWQELL
jgi:3'(2'), 5'-bisphosphate nucleotidase